MRAYLAAMAWTLPAARRRPTNLGVRDGQLAACPASPNCVSSQGARDDQAVEPIAYTGSREHAAARIQAVFAADPRARVIERSPDYVHVEYQAMMFVDDLEVYLPEDRNVIHIRSASRVGHSDLGANRRRVELIRKAFAAT